MKKQITSNLLVLCTLAFSTSAMANYLYGYGNVNVNYLNWAEHTKEASGGFKRDFAYIELEGGAGFSGGEAYGFFDIENVQESMDSTRIATKGSVAIKTGLDELRVYLQSYYTEDSGWHIWNNVAGVSYNFSGTNWIFAPYIGLHYTDTSGFVDMNGGMLGWFATCNFDLSTQRFQITNWHETEFARESGYTELGPETSDPSANGALALWWHATSHTSAGCQYRYAYNKLGQSDYNEAIIYTLKYNF